MKIIISPAKKMNVDTDSFEIGALPQFIEDAGILKNEIQSFPLADAKALWKCSDKLAELNYQRFQNMNLQIGLTPAIMAYEGLQYQHMAPGIFTEQAISYIEEHLRILSGFYGVLKPFDGVVPYRLEMQAKLSVNGHRDLYGFWGKRIYLSLLDSDRTIVNLASKEYSKCVEEYITAKDRFIHVQFGELIEGNVKQKGTLAKMARGEMVRFLAENRICKPEDMKEFHTLGFSYSRELSNERNFIFLK